MNRRQLFLLITIVLTVLLAGFVSLIIFTCGSSELEHTKIKPDLTEEDGLEQDEEHPDPSESEQSSVELLSEQMSASALNFTAEELDEATHAHLLKPRNEVILSLDAIMLGLGNSSCGPGVLKKYAVEKRRYELKVHIRKH